MFKKLQKVLLIDDSEPDNYIHKIKLEKAQITDEIIVMYGGTDALEYLTQKDNKGNFPNPELVFLDINMPGMSGWEFLEEYHKLDIPNKDNIIIHMLTTSISDSDKEHAANNAIINGFEHKPLTENKINKILQKYFPERFMD